MVTISRSANALIPMGNLYMDIYYSDGTPSDFVNVTNSVLSLLIKWQSTRALCKLYHFDLLQIYKSYNIDSNYTVCQLYH